MLTKIDCLNLIQIELASGKISADLWQKYPLPVISRVLGTVLDEICLKNPSALSQTAKTYTFPPAEATDGWYVTITPRPNSGTFSFTSVKDSTGFRYLIRDNSVSDTYEILRGGQPLNVAVLETTALVRFPSRKPIGDVKLAYIPYVAEMNDDDELILAGSEKYLIDTLLNLFRSRDNRLQEILNDSKVDAG